MNFLNEEEFQTALKAHVGKDTKALKLLRVFIRGELARINQRITNEVEQLVYANRLLQDKLRNKK